jgi:hypothetical protein
MYNTLFSIEMNATKLFHVPSSGVHGDLSQTVHFEATYLDTIGLYKPLALIKSPVFLTLHLLKSL